LPFLIFGIITFLFGFPLLLYPRQLPGTEEVRKNRQKEIYEDEMSNNLRNDEEFGKTHTNGAVSLARQCTIK